LAIGFCYFSYRTAQAEHRFNAAKKMRRKLHKEFKKKGGELKRYTCGPQAEISTEF